MDELQKVALNEILRTVTYLADEIIELNKKIDILIEKVNDLENLGHQEELSDTQCSSTDLL